MTEDDRFLAAFDALPMGRFFGSFDGKRFRVMRSVLVADRAVKLEAEELDGSGYINFNIYRLKDGMAFVKPFDMPKSSVYAFTMALKPD